MKDEAQKQNDDEAANTEASPTDAKSATAAATIFEI